MVDASVGIKLFLDEEYAEEVEALFASEAILLVPDLFHIECTNILWKRVSRGLYPLQSARENIADLYAMNLPTTPTAGLMARALELASQYKITAYDACYLALAELHSVPLLTEDTPLRNALVGSHIQTLTIQEYLSTSV
ncbi:MAG: type II toxin-antitoxin system VapC family toxin [Armatimonadota bacterium]